MRIALFVLLAFLVWVPATQGEEVEESEYSRMALRVKYSLFSTNIVQGPQSEKVAGMGLLFGGTAVELSARESLSQGIWMYNGTLDTDGFQPSPQQEMKHGKERQQTDLR